MPKSTSPSLARFRYARAVNVKKPRRQLCLTDPRPEEKRE
jgi:hypothetical protein